MACDLLATWDWDTQSDVRRGQGQTLNILVIHNIVGGRSFLVTDNGKIGERYEHNLNNLLIFLASASCVVFTDNR